VSQGEPTTPWIKLSGRSPVRGVISGKWLPLGEERWSGGGGTGPVKSAQLFHAVRRTVEQVSKGFDKPGGKLAAPHVALQDRALDEPEPKGVFPRRSRCRYKG